MTTEKPLFATLASLTSIDRLIEYFNLLLTLIILRGNSITTCTRRRGVGRGSLESPRESLNKG